MAVSRKVALLTALACTKRLGLPQLPPALWQKVRLFLDHDLHDLCADDPEGVFELKPRGAPVAQAEWARVLFASHCALLAVA